MESTRTAKEFSRVISCDYCARNNYPKLLRDDSLNLPQPGYIGSHYQNTRVLLVGQNPGSPADPSAHDSEFTDTQVALRDKADVRSLTRHKSVLDRIMPKWAVVQNYFPLAECGLQLDDIAYINVVRCRTIKNAKPGRAITQACINNHFIRWLDWLAPRVVVCIGKKAHDNVNSLLSSCRIPNGFINRWRSLSTTEREQNKKQVVDLVRSTLSGGGVSVAQKPQAPKLVRAPQVRPSGGESRPIQVPAGRRSTMDAEGYARLFKTLGVDAGNSKPNNSKVLRHPRFIISLYFNRNREVGVYFSTNSQHSGSFPPHLWVTVPPDSVNKKARNVLNIVPKAGKEREAIASLLA